MSPKVARIAPRMAPMVKASPVVVDVDAVDRIIAATAPTPPAVVDMAAVTRMRLTHAEQQEDAHIRGEHDPLAEAAADAAADAEAALAAVSPADAEPTTQGDGAPIAGPEGDGGDVPSAEGKDSTVAPNGTPAAKQEPETEREKRARERLLKSAEKKVDAGAKRIVAAFDKRDREEREWFPRMGRQIAEYLRDAVDLDVGRKTALAKLKTQAMVTLGGSIEQDITRAMQLNGAWTHFGDEFLTLPTRTQKSLASCFALGDEEKDGKATGHKVYELTELTADDATSVFEWVIGGNVETCPVNNPTYTASGPLAGPDADALIQAVKAAANKAAAEKAAGPDAKPTTGAAAAVVAGTKIEGQGSANKPAAGKPDASKPDATTKDAKTELTTVIRLPVKPVVAAAELVKALMAHDDKVAVFTALGHCKEVTTMLMDAMFVGMGEAGRVDDMIDMTACLEREVSIADYIGQQGGADKCSRADAVAAIRAKNPGLFAAAA